MHGLSGCRAFDLLLGEWKCWIGWQGFVPARAFFKDTHEICDLMDRLSTCIASNARNKIWIDTTAFFLVTLAPEENTF